MPKGCWGVVLAIGLTAVASAQPPPRVVYNGVVLECDRYGCWERSNLAEYRDQPSDAAGTNERPREEGDRAEPVPQTSITYAPSAHAPSEREEERAEEDLDAQQAMARWAFWMVAATLAGVLLIFWTLLEARRTSGFAERTLRSSLRMGRMQMREARKTTAQTALATQAAVEANQIAITINRPRVKVVSARLRYDCHPNGLLLAITVVNVGREIARVCSLEQREGDIGVRSLDQTFQVRRNALSAHPYPGIDLPPNGGKHVFSMRHQPKDVAFDEQWLSTGGIYYRFSFVLSVSDPFGEMTEDLTLMAQLNAGQMEVECSLMHGRLVPRQKN